jgi:glycyl-tRNA synthetase beta chain
LIDPAERQRIIAEGARAAASAAGLAVVEDEGLLAENAGLTEWPVPLLGGFDPAFLDVPPEVIQLTMRTNQKYFAVREGSGTLAPNFVCTANIEASDGGRRIVAGNEKVLAARLSDARFFWEQDLKIPLEDQAAKLSQIVFHEKLGTVHDKVERVAKLARWLVEEGIVGGEGVGGERVIPAKAGTHEHGADERGAASPSTESMGPGLRRDDESGDLAALAERAAKLCKADLVTGMVGEFPELQGLIGGYLARARASPTQSPTPSATTTSRSARGDEVPTAPVTVAVSLADKLDSFLYFFLFDLKPTGSKDPFGLRRSVLAILALLQTSGSRLPFGKLVPYFRSLTLRSDGALGETIHRNRSDAAFAVELIEFFADRLKVQQREAGVRHDLIDAVFALGGEDDLVRLLARVRALQAFVETAEGKDLLAGYKRAANILKKEGWPGPVADRHPELGSGSSSPSAGEAEAWTPDQVRGDDGTLAEHAANKHLSYTPEKEEAALIAALDSAEPRAAQAIAAEDFEGAMAALATLRAPVDAFFDKVTVNDPDPAKREARLDLLARMRDAVHAVADFSRIEG